MTAEGQSTLEGLREQLAGISRQIASLAEQVTQLQKGLAPSRIPVEQQKALLTRKEAAKMLSLSVRTIQRLIVRGDLKARRMGSRVLVPRRELERLASRDVVRIRPRG